VIVQEIVEGLPPDRPTVGALHVGGHDQQVPGVLVEKLV
jgi:hypothetical protein